MQISKRLGFVTLCLVFAAACGAALAADTDKFLGTWVFNAGKSQVPGGATPDKATIVVSDAGGGKLKSVSDTSVAGQQIHGEITFAADGKEYTPVTTPAPPPGSPTITETFERVSPTVYKAQLKMNGQTLATVMQEVSADGKTLTMTTAGAGPAANVTSTMVFDKK
jgi:hypothetical protein